MRQLSLQIIDFFSFQDPNVRWVTLGMVLICATAALVGVFTYLRKRSLIGDAVSHAILPGICLSFIISGTKNPFILLLGAFITGWLAIVLIDVFTRRTKLKTDTLIALVLSVFYGIGILLLTSIQNTGNASQAGLDKFLFGKAAALVYEDVMMFTVFATLIFIIFAIFHKSFQIIIFDRDFAQAQGYPVKFLESLLSTFTVLAVALGMQAVGVVLMAALLISPATSARYWTDKLTFMLILSVLLGAISGFFGAFISYTLPQMPTGPWVVIVLSLIAIFSVFLGSKKGILYKLKKQRVNQSKMLEENILKCFYHLGEEKENFYQRRSVEEIQSKRYIKSKQLKKGIKRLLHKKLLSKQENQSLQLSEKGKEIGQRITKIHRLWEIYLSKYMHLPQDHIHEDAEAIEHIITPEIEQALEKHLDYPEYDPHQSPIPYKT